MDWIITSWGEIQASAIISPGDFNVQHKLGMAAVALDVCSLSQQHQSQLGVDGDATLSVPHRPAQLGSWDPAVCVIKLVWWIQWALKFENDYIRKINFQKSKGGEARYRGINTLWSISYGPVLWRAKEKYPCLQDIYISFWKAYKTSISHIESYVNNQTFMIAHLWIVFWWHRWHYRDYF